MRKFRYAWIGAALLASVPWTVHAQGGSYPDHAIRMIVPFGPGGGTDLLARLAAERAGAELRQPIAVENRPGGGATLGIAALAQSRPDGYTIAICPPICATAPALYDPSPFRPMQDLATVISLADLPLVLVVRKGVGDSNMQDFVRKARAAQGGLTFASPGAGSSGHLASEMVRRLIDAPMVHVPYRSGAAALTDVVADRVDMYIDTVASALPQIRAGNVVALGVTGSTRAPQMPDVPTLAEAGAPGLENASPRLRIVVPAGTPAPVIERLNSAFQAAITDPGTRARLLENGATPVGGPAQESRKELEAEVTSLGGLIREVGVKAD